MEAFIVIAIVLASMAVAVLTRHNVGGGVGGPGPEQY